MSSTPAAAPPEGQVANFVNPETTHRVVGIVVAAVGMTIMSAIMILRMYTKTVLVHLFGIDDIVAALAWTASIVQQALYIYVWASKYLGTHVWDLTVAELNIFTRCLTASAVTGVLTSSLAKIALLLSYRKMWLVQWFKVTTIVGLVFLCCYSTLFSLTLTFPCVPLRKSWDVTVTTGHCLNKNTLYIGNSICSGITDVLIFVLPMPMVYNLRLRPFQKAGMIVMFSIASLTLIVNLVFLSLMIPELQSNNKDSTWSLSRLIVIVAVEANLVLICGCFPALRLFARRVAPRCFGTERSEPPGDVVGGGGGGGGVEFMPSPLWESELSTITTGISGESERSKESAKSGAEGGGGGGVQPPPKAFDYDRGGIFAFDASMIGSANRRTLGQVLPDP